MSLVGTAKTSALNRADEPNNRLAPPDVTIIVVSYCTRDMTLACLRSIEAETKQLSYQVLVVDNASNDGSAEAIANEFPHFQLFALRENLGFAVANNLAAKHATGRYILLLNPDTVVLSGAIDNIVSFALENPRARIWGGRTLYANGSLNSTSCWGRMSLWSLFCFAFGLTRIFRSSSLFNSEAIGTWQRDSIRNVDIVTGCFLLIDGDMWERLNGFDPAYFMYGEEADLCARARSIGARPMIYPDATIIHYGSASDTSTSEKRIKVFTGKVTLMKFHWTPLSAKIGAFALLLACVVRWWGYGLLGMFNGDHRSARLGAEWRDTWTQRSRWMPGYTKTTGGLRILPAATR